MKSSKENKEKATFAMGCFWQPDILFSKLPGVTKAVVGYTGGLEKYKNPNYQEVCSGKTGHAEAIEIEFNPKKTSYKELLEIFWKRHNPTTMNRQGPDVGSQYRSAIFYHNEKQKSLALETKSEAQKKFKNPIVTEIKKATQFYPAEDYHQKYLEKRGLESCHV